MTKVAPTTETRNFLQVAAQSDTYEILAGRTVLAETGDAEVRAFAQDMIQAHTRTSADLARAAAQSGLEPPPMGLGADQSPLLGALQSLKGKDFDRAYMRQQVIAHRQALVVQQTYAAHGADANLRQAATSAVPLIQHHLEMAERLNASLGGG